MSDGPRWPNGGPHLWPNNAVGKERAVATGTRGTCNTQFRTHSAKICHFATMPAIVTYLCWTALPLPNKQVICRIQCDVEARFRHPRHAYYLLLTDYLRRIAAPLTGGAIPRWKRRNLRQADFHFPERIPATFFAKEHSIFAGILS